MAKNINLTIGGTNATPALSSDLVISDDLNAVCRSLTFSIQQIGKPQAFLGRDVVFTYAGVPWYRGFIRKHSISDSGAISYTAYDPLFFWGKHADDWYFKTQTATQILQKMAETCGIKTASMANTQAVFSYLFYQGAQPEKIAIDVLARTRAANGRKFWHRYDPVEDGLILYERQPPPSIWAFQRGVNLTAASKTESVEDLYTCVKVVNREKDKVVIKTNSAAQTAYGKSQYFEEVNSDTASLDTKATELLAELSKVAVEMNISGVNPDAKIGQFFSGDPVYVEEPTTGIMGGYYIRNVTHTVSADALITLDFDIQYTSDLPAIQFEDADKKKK